MRGENSLIDTKVYTALHFVYTVFCFCIHEYKIKRVDTKLTKVSTAKNQQPN